MNIINEQTSKLGNMPYNTISCFHNFFFLFLLNNLLPLSSSAMSKILSAEPFGWSIIVIISNFVFISSQSNRKKKIAEQKSSFTERFFLAPCCFTLQLNQHVFFRYRKESAFLGIHCSKVKASKYFNTFCSWMNPRLISSSILQYNISEIQYIWMTLQVYLCFFFDLLYDFQSQGSKHSEILPPQHTPFCWT